MAISEPRARSSDETVRQKPPEKRLESLEKLIPELVDTERLQFDPHLHTEFSDGDSIHNIAQMALLTGIPSIGVADHDRDNPQDVMLYTSNGSNAYEIEFARDDLDEDWQLNHNIDLLREAVNDYLPDVQRERSVLSMEDALKAFYEEEGRIVDGKVIEKETRNTRETGVLDIFTAIERDYESWTDRSTVSLERKFDDIRRFARWAGPHRGVLRGATNAAFEECRRVGPRPKCLFCELDECHITWIHRYWLNNRDFYSVKFPLE
jgi:hypothetical protein